MKPVLQAILLAERIYQDTSGKKVIAGTFNTLFMNRKGAIAQAHPSDSTKQVYQGGADMGSPFVYISLTDCVPEIDLTIQVSNLAKNEVVLGQNFKLQCQDRLATIEMVLPLPPLRMFIVEPGTYSLDLIWNEDILGSHRIVAIDVTPV